ncbi:centrosomal protein of 162 kDa-like [Cydia amplana]|uniref:centrosomal protein of 162 kDa-like n=1 Tax=Cydia amplana TaxID=1869771 RepID=UPI002FE60C33
MGTQPRARLQGPGAGRLAEPRQQQLGLGQRARTPNTPTTPTQEAAKIHDKNPSKSNIALDGDPPANEDQISQTNLETGGCHSKPNELEPKEEGSKSEGRLEPEENFGENHSFTHSEAEDLTYESTQNNTEKEPDISKESEEWQVDTQDSKKRLNSVMIGSTEVKYGQNTIAVRSSSPLQDGEGFMSVEASGYMKKIVSIAADIVTKKPQPTTQDAPTNSKTIATSPYEGNSSPAMDRLSFGQGGIADAPREAMIALEEAKEALESRAAGNLKKEVRQMVVDRLYKIQGLVFKVSESRHRLGAELEREKALRAREVARLQRIHAEELKKITEQYHTLKEDITNIREESDSTRKVIEHDVVRPLDLLAKEQVTTIKEFLTASKRETGTPSETGPTHMNEEMRELNREVKELRRVIADSAPMAAERLAREVTSLREILQSQANEQPKISQILEEIKEIKLTGESNKQILVPEMKSLKEMIAHTRSEAPRNTEPNSQVTPSLDLILRTEVREPIRELREEVGTLRSSAPFMEIREQLRSLKEATEEAQILGGANKTPPQDQEHKNKLLEEIEGLRHEIASYSMTKMSDQKLPTDEEDESNDPWTKAESRKKARKEKRRRTNKESSHSPPPKPKFPLTIESKDPKDTSTTVIDRVKDSVDVSVLGIGVEYFRGIKKQKAAIGLTSEADREALKAAITEKCPDLKTITTELRKPLLRLVGVVKGLADDQIPGAIVRQNSALLGDKERAETRMRVLRRTRSRKPEVSNIIIEVDTDIWTCLKDRKVRLGYQVVPAYDQSPVIQCYACLRFGHFARDCTHPQACGYCAGQHDTKECQRREEPPKCVNCGKQGRKPEEPEHPAYSSECPEWRKWDRLARSQVRYC